MIEFLDVEDLLVIARDGVGGEVAVRNHALVDCNKRLAWLATYVFLDLNGQAPSAGQDEVVEFVLTVAGGSLSDVEKIAEQLSAWTTGS